VSTKTLLTIAIAIGSPQVFGQACTPPAQTPVIAYAAGTIIPDVGSSDMPITSKSEKAKTLVRQGFALIHCFWPNEAIRSFRDATKEDPTCAIAWCGLNISLTQPWFASNAYKAEAEYSIRQAIAHIEAASDAEQDLIRAFRLRSIGKDDRGSEFEKAMDSVVKDHSNLDEPRLLWAGLRAQLCMNMSYMPNGDPRQDLEFVIKLLEPVMKRNPNSPGAQHYWIHAYEPGNPKRAEQAADDLQRMAKGSAHMVHMAGHLYNRVGRYEDGQNVFQRAREMDDALGKHFKVDPGQATWQYHHNVIFQGKNLLELGRINETIELSKISGGLRRDIAARVGDWKNVGGRNGLEDLGKIRLDLEAKNLAAARTKIDELKKRLQKPEPDGWGRTDYRIQKTTILEHEGLVLAAEGKFDAAVAALRESCNTFKRIEYEEPVILIQTPFESLGEVHIRAKRYDEAVAAYRDGLTERPNSGWLLYGVARAYEEAGKDREAEQAYKVFLKAWATADKDRPELKRANDFMARAER
jgi:tetratricopeptide (TPR) repeat protein